MASRNARKVRRAGTLASDLMLAPMVMWMRTPLLATEARGGPGESRAETMRAVTEKTAALAQGAMAAQISLAGAAMRFWPEVFSGKTPSLLSGVAAEQALHAALKPASKRVKANYRRLSAKAGRSS